MSKVLVSSSNLTNIANAIREKNGSTDTYKPREMAGAILALNISSGAHGEALRYAYSDNVGRKCSITPLQVTRVSDNILIEFEDVIEEVSEDA